MKREGKARPRSGRAGRRSGEGLLEQLHGARRIAPVGDRATDGSDSLRESLDVFRRRQRDCELAKLGRHVEPSTPRGAACGSVESRGNVFVRSFRREREMPCPTLRVLDDLRSESVHPTADVRRRDRLDPRREQRVREPQPVAVEVEQVAVNRLFEGGGGDPPRAKLACRRLSEHGDEPERLLHGA